VWIKECLREAWVASRVHAIHGYDLRCLIRSWLLLSTISWATAGTCLPATYFHFVFWKSIDSKNYYIRFRMFSRNWNSSLSLFTYWCKEKLPHCYIYPWLVMKLTFVCTYFIRASSAVKETYQFKNNSGISVDLLIPRQLHCFKRYCYLSFLWVRTMVSNKLKSMKTLEN